MRRILIAIGTTLSGLVLLFSWPTSRNLPLATAAASDATGTGSAAAASGSTDSGTTGSGTTGSGSSASGSGSTSGSDSTSGSGSSSSTVPDTSSGSSSGDSSSDSSSGSSSGSDGTFVGASVDTRWGPVQVQITVADGAITEATAVEYPTSNGRDQQINAYAIPQLEQETLDVQGSGVDMISGATVTSRGYVASLQDAIDQAGL
jgi:uncharacterized protein with FMN-binding domain